MCFDADSEWSSSQHEGQQVADPSAPRLCNWKSGEAGNVADTCFFFKGFSDTISKDNH